MYIHLQYSYLCAYDRLLNLHIGKYLGVEEKDYIRSCSLLIPVWKLSGVLPLMSSTPRLVIIT